MLAGTFKSNYDQGMNRKKIGCLLFLLLIMVVLLAIFVFPTRRQEQHPYFANFDTYPLVIAHADDTGQGLWPGNTMPFFRGSKELGVDVLEFDVHMSKDGHLVVMHDETVDRTTNGSGKISDLTLQEIKSLEVAGDWSPDDGQTTPYKGQKLRVPTLAEVFYLFPDSVMNIEIKQAEPSMARALCEMIHSFDMSQKVLVPSFSDEAIAEFRSYCPEVATASGARETRSFVIANFALLSKFIPIEFEAFQVPESSSSIPVVIPHFINGAHKRNVQVHIWTVNDADDMQRFMELGVDGIMTDRPDLLLEIREQLTEGN